MICRIQFLGGLKVKYFLSSSVWLTLLLRISFTNRHLETEVYFFLVLFDSEEFNISRIATLEIIGI